MTKGIVTNGKWCVSYTSGGDIPAGKIRFTAYYFEGDKLVLFLNFYFFLITNAFIIFI